MSFVLEDDEFEYLFGDVDTCQSVFFWASAWDPNNRDIKYGPYIGGFYPNCPVPSTTWNNTKPIYYIYQDWRYSTQPYLILVINRVMSAIGYTVRRNDIAHSWMRNLYIVNYANLVEDWEECKFPDDNGLYDGLKRKINVHTFPHWSISTFIDEVEKFCACIFCFNSHNKTVDIMLMTHFFEDANKISVDDVMDEYQIDIEDSDEDKDISGGNVSFYKEYSDKYLNIDREVLLSIADRVEYDGYDSIKASFDSCKDNVRLFRLFVDKTTGREYIAYNDNGTISLKEINVFGELYRGNDRADVELRIVPATTVYRKKPDDIYYNSIPLNVPYDNADTEVVDISEMTAQVIIENNENADKSEDTGRVIEVMLSTGERLVDITTEHETFKYIAPFTDFNMPGGGFGSWPKMSLSLKDVCENSLGHLYRNIPDYRSTQTYKVKFKRSSLPDVRGIFLINNQKYVCRKLSVTYDDSDSFVFEGEFYRLEQ